MELPADLNDNPVLNGIKYDILREKRDFICSSLIPERHLTFLQSKFVLSEEDCEVIKTKDTRKQRASTLIDILLTKGPRCLEYLCEALSADGTQLFMLKDLNMMYEERRNNFLALFNVIGPRSPQADLHIDSRLLPRPPPPPSPNNNNLPYSSGGPWALQHPPPRSQSGPIPMQSAYPTVQSGNGPVRTRAHPVQSEYPTFRNGDSESQCVDSTMRTVRLDMQSHSSKA